MLSFNPKHLSVNFHLWEPCNMRCKFCFATFQDVKKEILPKGHLPKEDAINIVSEIAKIGFGKITFAGGEPTLCPWLPELLQAAKIGGMTTMVVTNGSTFLNKIFDKTYFNNLDWVTISVDSINSETNKDSGRAISGKKPIPFNEYLRIADCIRANDIRLKVNTVVHRLNYNEVLFPFINEVKPERWKVLKMLKVAGQNDSHADKFCIEDAEFEKFTKRNLPFVYSNAQVVVENNDAMEGSYLMIDPAGRLFDNINGRYSYSQPVLEVGLNRAIKQISFSRRKFEKRGGVYKW